MYKISIRLSIIALVLGIIALFTISAGNCAKRNTNTKTGSSNIDAFVINAPSNLIATVIFPLQIAISWQDNSSNDDGFAIERKEWSTGTWDEIARVGININSYEDSELLSFIDYYYRVRAFNLIGDYSNYSNEANAITSGSAWSIIASGMNHSFAVNLNGMLWAWGNNSNGQLGLNDTYTRFVPNQVGIESDWSRIAGGEVHTLGLKTDGSLWSWGGNGYGQLGMGDTLLENWVPFQVGFDSDWNAVATGERHSMALKTNRTIWSWGYNNKGQLGHNDLALRVTPTQIGTSSDWCVISAGYYHTAALKTNDTIWAWGDNQYGQLGLGNSGGTKNSPVQIGTNSDWVSIRGNKFGTAALKTNNTIWVWGSGYSYVPAQINSDSDWAVPNPVALKTNSTIWEWWNTTIAQIGTDMDWSATANGELHKIALKTNGSIWIWGNNDYGQLGLSDSLTMTIPTQLIFGIPDSSLILPVAIASSGQIILVWNDYIYNEQGFEIERKEGRLGTYEQLATVSANTVALTDSGPFSPTTYYYRIRVFNSYGWSVYSSEAYTAISGIFADAAGTEEHTVSRKFDGTIWGWGKNDSGQLGLGDSIQRTTVTRISTATDWINICANGKYSVGIRNNSDGFGTLWSWGENTRGQLGLGDTGINRNTPTQIGTQSDWSLISCGWEYSVACKSNKTMWVWGYNGYGQLGLGHYNNRVTPTAIGSSSDWSKVATASYHNIAMKTNGTLWSWGSNPYGQLGLGDTLAGRNTPTPVGSNLYWLDVAIGSEHSVAIKTNNTLWVWGYNSYGQLGLGDSGNGTQRITLTQIGTNSDWVSITCGAYHCNAVKTNGTLWSWGRNYMGQLGLGDSIDRYTPSQTGTDYDWAKTRNGSSFTIGFKTNNTIWAWGQNNKGQLGLGNTITDSSNIPTLIGE